MSNIPMFKNKEFKQYSLYLPVKLHKFFVRHSFDMDKSMREIVIECLEKYKKKVENKLTV